MFDVTAFVRARGAFAQGRGPVEAWERLHVLSVNRVWELAEREGAKSWAMLIGPLDTLASTDGYAPLAHSLRSMGYGHIRCRIHWQNHASVVCSPAVVVPRLLGHRAARLAQRRHQLAIVQVLTAPARLEVVNVATSQRMETDRIDAAAIANMLAALFDATRVLIEYTPSGWFEGLACSIAERRLREIERT